MGPAYRDILGDIFFFGRIGAPHIETLWRLLDNRLARLWKVCSIQ